jgi:mannitol/fructose-specific phosphotransferase system IIA component (Ntr-type)
LSVLIFGVVLGFGLIYALFCLGGKVFGAGGPALLAGFNTLGAMRIGVGMAPRCEVALTIAGIALAAGLVEAPMFAAVVIMVLVNTLLAGPTLQMLYRRGGPGLRNPHPGDHEHRECTFDFPNHAITAGVLQDLQQQFNDEGFYVHCLSHSDRLYQALKDDIAIDFSGSGTQICIRCKGAHLALANALMNEALADLERMIRELKPMDAQAVRQLVSTESVPTSGHATFVDSLHPDRIVANLVGEDKLAVIEELLAVIAKSGLVDNIESAREAVYEREASMPTGLEQGIAMPHARTNSVRDLVCAFGVHRSGVDFGAFDGEPSQLIALVLAPREKPGYVQFIAGLTQTLQLVNRERLFANSGAEGVYAVICNTRS